MKTVNGMVNINIRQSKTAYLISGIILLAQIANAIVMAIILGSDSVSESIALNNYLYLLPLLIAIFIPAKHFGKLMNLGGKRMDFFKSSVLTYLYVVAAVMAVSMTMQLFIIGSSTRLNDFFGIYSLLDVFGFMKHGAVAAFFQMSAFLLLFCCILHTLTLIQGHWYGWLTNIIIVAIISVFTPIAPLRNALIWFFNMIIFHDSAIVQILSCIVLSAAVYGAGLIPIKTKQI